MPADRLLITLLRSLQTYTDQQDTPRLLATAASVFATLSNPLNLTLLTAQLLSAPAIWTRPDGLRTCVRVMGVFHSAVLAILKHEDEVALAREEGRPSPDQPDQSLIGGGLSREEWVASVIKGADERSPRWRHILVIAGLLSGLEGQGRNGMTKTLRGSVECGFVKAVNLALEEARHGDDIGAHAISLALNLTWDLLGDEARRLINYDHLLPVLVGSSFFSNEGYRSGYFLANVDSDIISVSGNMFTWSPESSSFHQVREMTTKPLISGMGALSKLTSYTIEHLHDSWLVQSVLDDLLEFSKTLVAQWRNNKLSEVDFAEESVYFDKVAMTDTLPVLWRLLRSVMFSTVLVLQGVVNRLLQDPMLSSDSVAPTITLQTLHTLRNISFISSRLGSQSSSKLVFVYLTAIDVLSVYPAHADAFLHEIRPSTLGSIPSHPLDRTHDLYFLNTAEHFTLQLSPRTNEELLIASTTPYLASGGNNNLLEIFEAAHSVMLAVLSTPQSADLAAKHLPFYVDALFKVFPKNLSPRQFRLAFKTLLQLSAPPAPVSATHPELPEALLELLRHRALNPSSEGLLPRDSGFEHDAVDERTVIALTLIDCLPYLPPALLEEWLPLTADILPTIVAQDMRKRCQKRFWEVLSAGDMDVERSAVCVSWWGTKGGRERVMQGSSDRGADQFVMSGALQPLQATETKL